MGLAAHMIVSAHGFLPSGGWGDNWVGDADYGVGKSQPGGWGYQLLDYMEQSARREVGSGLSLSDKRAEAKAMIETALPDFYCPSRRAAIPYHYQHFGGFRNADFPAVCGRSDYGANMGDVDYFISDNGPLSYADAETYNWINSGPVAQNLGKEHTGVIFQRSDIKLSAITDGTSSTYLFGEKHHVPELYANGMAPNDDQSMYNGHDQDNLRSTNGLYPPGKDSNVVSQYAFGSAHPSGWQAVFCDGSVQSVTYSVDLEVHRVRGNRKDGIPTD